MVPGDGGQVSRGIQVQSQQVRSSGPEAKGTITMGLARRAASILTFGRLRYRGGRQLPAKAARAQAGLAEAETKVAEEQAAAIARALRENEAHQRADLEEVAEEEAEAVPWHRPQVPRGDIEAAADRPKRQAS